MKIENLDTNDFFRQATMRICGTLDIETAMTRCLNYISRFIPGRAMYFQLFRTDLNALETIAAVELDDMVLDRFIQMPEKDRSELKTRWASMEKVRIINRFEEFAETRRVTDVTGKPESSALVMRLELEGKRLGLLSLAVQNRDCYTQEHADLFYLLHEPCAIAMTNVLRYRELLTLKDDLVDDNHYLKRELKKLSGEQIIGSDSGLKDVMERVRQVATLTSPVLLLGETGVGKELIANAIHYSSERKEGPFIKVNCGAIPENLIDSELFGHEKGAFTGAAILKRGRFERANKGTIFLDEVGELPLQAQVRLLRVIQNKEIERVGGSKTLPLDVRIISATNRNLDDMVKKESFREDLYFRIHVFPITIPPLRQRREDIPELAAYFVRKKTQEMKLGQIPEISVDALRKLQNSYFRGNVREMENMIERALIRHRTGFLTFDFSEDQRQSFNQTEPDTNSDKLFTLDEINRSHIEKILKYSQGKIHGTSGAAEILKIHPNTLRKRMDKLGIPYRKNKRGVREQ